MGSHEPYARVRAYVAIHPVLMVPEALGGLVVYGSNPRPCALGFVSPGFDRVSRPPLLTVRGGGTRPILESNGGSIRSYVQEAIMKGEGVPGMITRPCQRMMSPCTPSPSLHSGRVRPWNPHYPPEWAPVPPLHTVSRGGVRLEPGTHKPQCTGSRVTPIHYKAS